MLGAVWSVGNRVIVIVSAFHKWSSSGGWEVVWLKIHKHIHWINTQVVHSWKLICKLWTNINRTNISHHSINNHKLNVNRIIGGIIYICIYSGTYTVTRRLVVRISPTTYTNTPCMSTTTMLMLTLMAADEDDDDL